MYFYWWSATLSQISLKFAFEKVVCKFSWNCAITGKEKFNEMNAILKLFDADNHNLTNSINGAIFIRKFNSETSILNVNQYDPPPLPNGVGWGYLSHVSITTCIIIQFWLKFDEVNYKAHYFLKQFTDYHLPVVVPSSGFSGVFK